MQFKDLHLDESLLRALAEEGYKSPTPIQEAAIPAALAGEDLLATAQTGTGKTAAFSLPILQNLETPKAKGSRPTR
ncbi:MAG: DEAD/DEAH box helicase, partial [Pirellulaceae bacterium]|nr:DEAD/DEAH box helicase [Pirellulaceae bacterium]